MINLLQTIFSAEMYSSKTERIQAQFLFGVLGVTVLLTLVSNIINLVEGTYIGSFYPFITLLILIIIYTLVRYKYLAIASWIFLVIAFISLSLIYVFLNFDAIIILLFNISILLLAGFLLGTLGNISFTALSILQLLVLPGLISEVGDTFSVGARIIFVYLTVSAILYMYNRFVIASRLEGQDIESIERLKLADITMQITRQASTRVPFQTALNETLDLILENYPEIYHAQVFLIDTDGVQARLTASTGEVGQQLIANQHALAVGSMSVIGQTTLRGETIIARAGEKDSTHRTNELLPDTQLEVAFPLQVGTEIIGALDLQSKVLDTLSANDRLTFQSLANSLSLTIDSIRQFEQSQARIEENQRLTEQTRAALHEVERLNQRLIGRAWTDYTRGVGDELGLMTDFEADTSETYLEWSEALVNAVNSNGLVQNGNIMAVPLRVRGQVVGAVEFELDEHNEITSEDLDLVREVSERFGLAAENTRLLEESLRTAQREALINQVTSSFQASQNVEATLAEAARSISESLEAGKVMIRLGMPDASHNGKDS